MQSSPLAVGGPIDGHAPERQRRWIGLIVALGIAARLFRWLLAYPLWSDEAFLSVNFLQRGYGDMFRSLEYHQVCPLGFLWAQLTAVRLLGFSELALRVVPLLASIAGLLLFVWLASRMLSGAARLLAVAVFACSYPGLRYASDAKPYGMDVLVAVGLLVLAVEWARRPNRQRWSWALVAAAPLAMVFSFTTAFVAGGISLAVLVQLLWQASQRRTVRPIFPWLVWLAFNLTIALSFLVTYWLCIRPQSQAELTGQMQPYWHQAFPPFHSAGKLLAWLFWTHTGDMLSYPVGGPRCASLATTLVCLLGLGVLVRRRRWDLLTLGLAPLALNFAAAAVQRYPYGGHVRVVLYLMPFVCLLAGLGLAAVLGWFAERRAERAAWLPAMLMVLALVPIGSMIRDASHSGKTPSDVRARDFARWFWFEQARQAELVCLKTDWQLDLAPNAFDYGYSSLYLCNQRIYSARHRRGEPPCLERVSDQWPLRCVLYHSTCYPLDQQAFDAWLSGMQARWRLVGRRGYPLTHAGRRDRPPLDRVTIDVWEFVPRR
jgi:hypothetical protein